MPKLLVFAGTTEGRVLLQALSRGIHETELTVHACVATDYGRDLLPEGLERIQIRAGRLTEEEMILLMKEHQFDYVIDTTHPYAKLASENIRAACKRAGCKYIRVLRSSGIGQTKDDGCLFFDSHEAVASYLKQTVGKVLLTIGSKELSKYTKIQDYQQRLFPRVLPMVEVVESCYILGFSGKQLICMQGPFSTDLNISLINQINASYMVTKDSGETGGFYEKYQAAQRTGTTLLVIGRGGTEEGISLVSLYELLEKDYHISLSLQEETGLGQWFPLFTNISGKTIVVVGAGKIAKRRIETLLKFECRIKVVAEEAMDEVKKYAEKNILELHIKQFETSDLEGSDYVLAVTNEKQLNHEIYAACKENNIPVNVADDKDKSDFYFPGIIRKNGVTVGVTAEGENHGLAKKATRAISHCLETSLRQEGGKIGTKKN